MRDIKIVIMISTITYFDLSTLIFLYDFIYYSSLMRDIKIVIMVSAMVIP